MRLFAAGFRPFFLAAGLAALLLVPLWAWVFACGGALPNSWPPTLWHAHEMVFGFLAAAIAGFLLTAVPSWTGRRGFGGPPVAMLAALWLLARVLIATADLWPHLLVAAVDVAFLPMLALLIAPPLLRSGNRNTPLLTVFGLLAICDAAFHWQLAAGNAALAARCLRVAIDVVLVLVTVIGGRIVPAFTSSGLRDRDLQVRSRKGIGAAAIAVMAVVAVVDALRPDGMLSASLAAAAALIQAVRLAQWRSLHTLGRPIVWILHVGYAWMPLGLALKSVALFGGDAFAAFWLHALTVGCLSTMILGVMTRAALGHSGRPLELDPRTVASYVLLLLAALARVFGFAWLALPYPIVILLAASLWTAAFALFVWVYAPILFLPRADGRPG
ncbi:MAG: NnrS family protein [Gammaproteobacteria bacterium]|nr:NnrS family protein [Gammaproteobacteria bacterium]